LSLMTYPRGGIEKKEGIRREKRRRRSLRQKLSNAETVFPALP